MGFLEGLKRGLKKLKKDDVYIVVLGDDGKQNVISKADLHDAIHMKHKTDKIEGLSPKSKRSAKSPKVKTGDRSTSILRKISMVDKLVQHG